MTLGKIEMWDRMKISIVSVAFGVTSAVEYHICKVRSLPLHVTQSLCCTRWPQTQKTGSAAIVPLSIVIIILIIIII